MTVRTARQEDLPRILELYAQLVPDDDRIATAAALDIWNEIASNNSLRYFVAELDGHIVSSCNVTIIPNLTHGGRPFAVIENVITDKAARGKGAGRAVMQAAIDFARSRGCYKVQLMSGAQRTEAHSFYDSLGFDRHSKVGFDLRLP